jgi:spore germination protein GerM
MSRRAGPVRLVLLLVAVTMASTACGIPTGSSPTPIAKADVPFHLLDPVTPATVPTSLPPAVGVPETIYLVAPDQHVVAVTRYLRVPASLTQILGALVEGPTQAESSAGLQSFLTPKITVSASLAGDVATVDFSDNPSPLVGPDQTLAIAQVVFTATQQPGVNGVVFEIDGQPTDVTTASGVQVPGPVSRSTYAPQAPLA